MRREARYVQTALDMSAAHARGAANTPREIGAAIWALHNFCVYLEERTDCDDTRNLCAEFRKQNVDTVNRYCEEK